MTDCVFCDPEKIKPRTIASLRDANIVATLGQITEGGYVLLIPKKHVPCIGAVNKYRIKAIDKIAGQIIKCLEKKYQSAVTVFEHGIIGQTIKHAHIHFFPADIDITNRVRSDFFESERQDVDNFAHLQQLYETKQEPYLLWSTVGGKYQVCWNPPAPPQYLRTISAGMLYVPERADWKKMDPELDRALIDETIRTLAPCFN